MDKTKALNIFRSFCLMLCLMVILTFAALGIVNFVRLPESVQIGIGLAIVITLGTSMIYTTIYGGGMHDYGDDYDDYSEQE